MIGKTKPASAAVLVLAGLACTHQPEADGDNDPRLLQAGFTEELHVGDDPSERLFADITSMAFAPDGRLVVIDDDEFAVRVLDRTGTETARWGGKGEGPGEFENKPVAVAVSDDGEVSVRSYRRIDVFTLEGGLVGSHLLDMSAFDVAFSDEGKVVARAEPQRLDPFAEAAPQQIVRLPEHDVLWSAPPRAVPLNRLQLGKPTMILAGLGHGRVLVGMNDEYDMPVLDATTGREFGRIARDVSLRGPTEEFNDRIRQEGLATATHRARALHRRVHGIRTSVPRRRRGIRRPARPVDLDSARHRRRRRTGARGGRRHGRLDAPDVRPVRWR